MDFLAIELSCGEYGNDKIDIMVNAMENGKCLQWFENPQFLPSLQKLRGMYYKVLYFNFIRTHKKNGKFKLIKRISNTNLSNL